MLVHLMIGKFFFVDKEKFKTSFLLHNLNKLTDQHNRVVFIYK